MTASLSRTSRPATHPLRTRHAIVAPALRIGDAAAAAVFNAARLRGRWRDVRTMSDTIVRSVQ